MSSPDERRPWQISGNRQIGVRPSGGCVEMSGSPRELRDAMVRQELLGNRADVLAEQLACTPLSSRASLLDSTLRSWLDGSSVDAGTMPLAGLCFQRLGRVPVLAEQFGLSQRQVQRLFLRDVGLTPTEVVRLHRFRRAMDRLIRGRPGSLSALAFELGYADHAHFTRSSRNSLVCRRQHSCGRGRLITPWRRICSSAWSAWATCCQPNEPRRLR